MINLNIRAPILPPEAIVLQRIQEPGQMGLSLQSELTLQSDRMVVIAPALLKPALLVDLVAENGRKLREWTDLKTQIEKRTFSFPIASLKEINPLLEDKPGELIVGIEGGEFHYTFITEDLHRAPLSKKQHVLISAALATSALTSYGLCGQNVLTKKMSTLLSGFVNRDLLELPKKLQVGVPFLVTGLFTAFDKMTAENFPVKVSFLGVILCSLLFKKYGKNFGKGDVDVENLFAKQDKAVSQGSILSMPISPLAGGYDPLPLGKQVTLNIQIEGDKPYISFKVGKKEFEKISLTSKTDEDQEEDVDKEGNTTPSSTQRAVWLALTAYFAAAALLDNDKSHLAALLMTLFSSASKAEIRQMPFFNGYSVLSACLGISAYINYMSPGLIPKKLFLLPVSVFIADLKQRCKDADTGKPPKNDLWFDVPDFIKWPAYKLGIWKPKPFVAKTLPFQEMMEDKKGLKLKMNIAANQFGENNPATPINFTAKMSGEKIKGGIKINGVSIDATPVAQESFARSILFPMSCLGLILASARLTDDEEGIAPYLFLVAFCSWLKQVNIKWPFYTKYAVMGVVTTTGLITESYLEDKKMLSQHFGYILLAALLTMVATDSKRWIFGKKDEIKDPLVESYKECFSKRVKES